MANMLEDNGIVTEKNYRRDTDETFRQSTEYCLSVKPFHRVNSDSIRDNFRVLYRAFNDLSGDKMTSADEVLLKQLALNAFIHKLEAK